MNIDIRPAQPTPQDAHAFAELANTASHDLVEDFFGSRYGDILGRLFLQSDNLWSHNFSHFATVDGQHAGLIYGYTHAQQVALDETTGQALLAALGDDVPRMRRVQGQLQPILEFMNRLPEHAYYLRCIAVHARYRQLGLGKRLLEKADEIALSQDQHTLQLDTETINAAAIEMYQRHGMQIAFSSPVVFYAKQGREISMHRMVKILQ